MRRQCGERQKAGERRAPTGERRRRLHENIGNNPGRALNGLCAKHIHHLCLHPKSAVLCIHDLFMDRVITLNPYRPFNLA